MDRAHIIENISVSDTIMHLRVDGADYDVDLAVQSVRLAHATPEQRSQFVISPSGYGIHWPHLDEDLSIDGLIGIKHTRPTRTSI